MSTLITIDLDALAANFRYCKHRLSPSTCAAVVKADGYGLGIRHVARALHHAGCSQFFTATHREGIVLRSLLPEVDIFVLEGVSKTSVKALCKHRLVPVLISRPQALQWIKHAARLEQRLPAVINIDSGMTRLGFGPKELQALLLDPGVLQQLDLRYVMTHFACADEPGAASALQQLDRFNEIRTLLPPTPTSIGNSAGGLLGPEFAGDMARMGIALFGGNPYLDENTAVQAVLRVQSRILQLRDITQETTVGYGATFTATPGMRIATVGIGYADGYPWSLGNHGIAAVGGHRVPVIGRVSMDLITLDVTGVPADRVRPGSLVDLIGPDITLEEVAERAGTISYEILTRLSQRASRTFLGGPPD